MPLYCHVTNAQVFRHLSRSHFDGFWMLQSSFDSDSLVLISASQAVRLVDSDDKVGKKAIHIIHII
jgi:hypothetical protein